MANSKQPDIAFLAASTEDRLSPLAIIDLRNFLIIGLSMLSIGLLLNLDCLAVLEETNRGDKAALFAGEHILRWLPSLIQQVTERGTIAFYRVWATGLQTMLVELYEV